MKYNDITLTFGTCENKTDSHFKFDLYISPNVEELNSKDIQNIKGTTLDDPVYQLVDAKSRSIELCAPYLSCEYTINFMKGTHYISKY